MRLWSTDGVANRVVFENNLIGLGAVFSPDGESLLVGSAPPQLFGAEDLRLRVIFPRMGPTGRSIFSNKGDKLLLDNANDTISVWTVDSLTVLWRQSPYCLSASERVTLLGQTVEHAQIEEKRCRETARRCSRSPSSCQEAVAENYTLGRLWSP